MILTVYAEQISKRLKYVLSIVFDIREIDFRLVNDIYEYQQAAFPKFAYSDNPLFEENVRISPSSLLFEEELLPVLVEKDMWNNHEVLKIEGVSDILASIFYVITLYDDTLQEETDEHDRNIGAKSILYKYGWLDQLIVERWSEQLIDFIEKHNNYRLETKVIPFNIIPTFDIDNVYAYRLKTGWRKLMSIGRDVLKFDKFRLKERKDVLSGLQKDPYDTYHIIESIAKKGFDVKVFWLLGDYATFDRNVNYEDLDHQKIIKEVNEYAEVNLHPSYRSNQAITNIREEKTRLETIIGQEVTHSRQHFLKVKVPYTFRELSKVGFTDDYSLGYADKIGFRAGVARSFPFYDLKVNHVTNLILHPISYMDGTLNEYMKLSIDEAIEVVQGLKKEVQTYGGDFVALWHNETIGDYGKWKGWSRVLNETLK
ncbi:polysaccharide deacetylase family protein [Brumimicrobium aurantiacum]|uniref:DUF7033 domain-containing protein n=1 Tax=Brumimicrobium aurantiacum TaxID=1737063 RepID=A0A3E1EUD3_9FLAO|nr:polysaccharide deacetylase family protein [Brumimicrobium aurantiacum]RFC53167.1 hypothetical protein DXU93_14500 [Brumimicrobium aurantiacum]